MEMWLLLPVLVFLLWSVGERLPQLEYDDYSFEKLRVTCCPASIEHLLLFVLQIFLPKTRATCGTAHLVPVVTALLTFGSLVSASEVTAGLHVEARGRALQGQPYRLLCVVTHAPAPDPPPAHVWYRNGLLLDTGTGPVLSFTRLSKSDEGNYQCQMGQGNAGGVQLSHLYTLSVTVFENISLVPEVEVEEWQTAILNCSVLSDPTAYLTWRLDGKDVRTVRSNSDSLVLHNASRLHLAVVQCQAYNEALVMGFMTAYSLIRIKGTYEIVPRPWLGPRGVPVLHRRFGMECLVMDIPNQGVNVHLTYTWYKDDTEIEGQASMILEFPSMTREDTGVYTCTARNGKVQTTSLQSNELEVVVLVPPVVHIEPKTPDNIVKHAAGQSLTLTCKVTQALPGVATDGYIWSYLPSPRGQLRPLEGRESTLTLGPLTREDSGQYFCQAWNYEDFGGLLPPGNASVTLDVLYLENISLTADLEVHHGEHVTLTCQVDCHPPARLAWIVDGQEVRHVTAKVDHYVLERAACSDSKTYTCRASNPDLPGLETNASTHLRVNCSHLDEEVVTSKGLEITTVQIAADWDSTPLIIALPIVIIVLALVIILVLVGCCVRRRRRKQRGERDANNNADERQPMQDSPVVSSM